MPQRGSNRFNQREITRAIKGVEEAGRTPERIEVDPKTGKITIVVRGEAASKANNNNPEHNEWDEEWPASN
jgi:hypothetical protein